MIVTAIHKFGTYKDVRLDLDKSDTERDIRLVALASAGETVSSTSGVSVTYMRDGFLIPYGDDTTGADSAMVIIHTD